MKLLVALDGSEAADRAFQRALQLMKPGDHLVLLTITDLVHFFITSGSVGSVEQLKKGMKERAGALLKQYAEKATSQSVEYSTVEAEGNVREVICDQIVSLGVNIILIGQVGLSVSKSISIGSTSDYVIRNATCDVLLVK